MSNKNFLRRRRGMHFRPKGGLGQTNQKPDQEAIQARADVVSEQGGVEHVFEKRHVHEIERAENLAAGLPPSGVPENAEPKRGCGQKRFSRAASRHPHACWGGKTFRAGGIAGTAQRGSWTPSNLPRQIL